MVRTSPPDFKALIIVFKLNRFVMGTVFFVPLMVIALYESTFDTRKHAWMESWFRGDDEGDEDRPENRDPPTDDPDCPGLKISKVPFEELIKVFPNIQQAFIFHIFGCKLYS